MGTSSGRTCALLQPRLTWRVCCQGRVGRRQAKQQRLPTKQLGGLELELNQAAHAQLWLSSMQRLPRARTRKQARRLRTLISRRTLPTMERGRRLAEKQLRLTSACFECHIESNFPLSSSRARKARNTFVRVYQK